MVEVEVVRPLPDAGAGAARFEEVAQGIRPRRRRSGRCAARFPIAGRVAQAAQHIGEPSKQARAEARRAQKNGKVGEFVGFRHGFAHRPLRRRWPLCSGRRHSRGIGTAASRPERPLQSTSALRLHCPLRGRYTIHRVCAKSARARTGAQQRPRREIHGRPASGAAGLSGSVPNRGEGAGAPVRGEATDASAEGRVGRRRKTPTTEAAPPEALSPEPHLEL